MAEGTSKGSRIKVTGHLRSEGYEAKDGTRRRLMKVVAEQVEILSARPAPTPEDSPEPRPGERAA